MSATKRKHDELEPEKKEGEASEETVEAPPTKEAKLDETAKGEDKEENGAGEEFDPEKLLVTQLKGELNRRGFKAVGRKGDLVQKLKDAIAGKIQPDAPELANKAAEAAKKKKEAEQDDGLEDSGLRRGRRQRKASLRAQEAEKGSQAQDEEGAEEAEEKKTTPKKRAPRKKAAAKKEEEEEEEEGSAPAGDSQAATPKAEEKKGEGKNFVWSPNPNAPVDPITDDDSKYLKIISWNLNGLAAVLKKDYLQKYVELEKPDVICFQETKWQESTRYPNDMIGEGWTPYWSCSTAKKGYAGTAVFTKVTPLNVTYGIGIKEHDDEGRTITLEFDNFFLVNTYIPNSGQALERLEYRQVWDKDFLAYLKKLEQTKPVVWCGDLNVAHTEIDLANPKGNKKTAGFTDQERKGFSTVLENGFVDTWRYQNPDKKSFTYWSYRFSARQKNIGWRLDYFVVSEKFVPQVGPSFIRPDVLGSDHCPIGLLIKKD